jgi:hypothetical protein
MLNRDNGPSTSFLKTFRQLAEGFFCLNTFNSKLLLIGKVGRKIYRKLRNDV